MCGFFGSINLAPNHSSSFIDHFSSTLKHRGPDAFKYFSNNKNVILGHLRLSILDDNERSDQPFSSQDGRYHLAFNGEIYNHKHIRKLLLNEVAHLSFYTESDTETLFQSLIHFGLKRTLDIIDGMYSFSFIDLALSTIVFARDPFGQKPLYISVCDNTLLFSSELRALNSFLNDSISQDYIQSVLFFGYAGYNKFSESSVPISAGTALLFDFSSPRIECTDHLMLEPLQYIAAKPSLDSLLIESVLQVITGSDTQPCLFLSGGIDSSLIAAISTNYSNIKLDTFSVSIESNSYDESIAAKNISSYLGLNHTVVSYGESYFLDSFVDIISSLSSPIADSSIFPMHYLCNYVSDQYKVAIGGDGADEVFFGYNRHSLNPNNPFLRLFSLLSPFLQDTHLPYFLSSLLSLIIRRPEVKYKKLLSYANALSSNDLITIYSSFFSNNQEFSAKSRIFNSLVYSIENSNNFPSLASLSDRIRTCDLFSYLPNNILVKSDFCSMSNSLELRSPFLSLNLFKYFHSIIRDECIVQGVSKSPMRNLLYSLVPPSYFRQPKSGFGSPINYWLKPILPSLIAQYFSDHALSQTNLFPCSSPESIRENLFEETNFDFIWRSLVCQIWLLNNDYTVTP